MLKNHNIDVKIPLIILSIAFSILYFPSLSRPYSFEELKVTDAWFASPPESSINFMEDTRKASKFQEYWKSYLRVHPPGLLAFYRIWKFITFESEFLMRLPLLFLTILCFIQFFRFFSELTSPQEGSIMLLVFGMLPFWFNSGARILPESFGFLLMV